MAKAFRCDLCGKYQDGDDKYRIALEKHAKKIEKGVDILEFDGFSYREICSDCVKAFEDTMGFRKGLYMERTGEYMTIQ